MSTGKPETYSFSKLSAYDTCPRMWELTYIDHAPKLENTFAAYGTLTHRVLERYAKGELPLDSLPGVFEWEWDAAFGDLQWPPNKYVDLEHSYKNQGIDFLRNFPGFSNDVEVLGVEQHFEFPISDFILQGFIDLAYRQKNKLAILDWKTAKAYSKTDLVSKERQPYLYSMWCKNEFGRFPDEIVFWHTRDNKRVVLPFKEEIYNAAIHWATTQVNTIRNAWYFPPNPNEFFCRYICSVRGSCECGTGDWWKHHR